MTSDSFTVTIDSLSYGGRGVGRRQDGKVAFIPFVIPGETVRARVEREHPSYCIAEAAEILDPSPERIAPVCSLFTQCGGCDWQHIPYPSQLQWKNRILLDEVSRALRMEGITAQPPVPSERTYGYRGHAVLQCHGSTMGFFRKKSNSIIPVDTCPVLNQRIQDLIPGLKEILKGSGLQAIRSIEIHFPDQEAILEVNCGKGNKKVFQMAMEKMRSELGINGVSFVSPFGRQVLGNEACSYGLEVKGERVLVSSSFGEFIQANLQVNLAMVDHVAGLAAGSGTLVDLYSGSGNFSIPLARSIGKVFAVEWSKGLVAQGKASASRNRVGNIEFMATDAASAVREMKLRGMTPDTIVLDPPREGAKDAAPLLPGLGAQRIIYISCNPTTLARDLKPLIQDGYSLKGLRLFDMFPQTYHIEAVACLHR
jgi:23S rRNA (uracil1939-C5)-methyltransferase